jgi:hypothetical protein
LSGCSQLSRQRSAGLAYSQKKKQTRRETFLTEMDQVIPQDNLCALIEPHYPKPTKTRGGRVPMPLLTKLRVYCLQQFYDLSDPGAEEALYDSESMRRVAHWLRPRSVLSQSNKTTL